MDKYFDIDVNAPRLTLEEFRDFWLQQEEGQYMSAIDSWEESLHEAIAQYRSECALYGDAGPGQALHIQRDRDTLARIRRVLAL